jgi:glycosyltransferase involved in cell wall biosynthesis
MNGTRILHVDSGREMRGGQWQVLRLIEGLLAQGVECVLLARRQTPLFREVQARGWQVAGLSLARLVIQARRCDLVHAHDARSHTLAALAGGVPLVVSRRVAFPIGSRWKYREAVHYIAVSKFVAGVLVEGGVPAERISVVYDGVPLLFPAPERAGVLAPANAYDPRKGAAIAAQAAELAEVELEFSPDLERDLPRAAIFVYITHSEGLGSGVLLAMSAGAAVIASNIGGLPEIVEHRETGLLVDNTPQAVAGAIRELLRQPAYARQLAECARRRVEKQFSVEQMVHRTMEVYRQVLA